MKRVLVQRTGLFQHEAHRTCLVDALYVEQQDSGYFQVREQFPLVGN